MKIFSIILVTLSLVYMTSAQGNFQPYVDDQLIGAGLKNGAIMNQEGDIQATSPEFPISISEAQAIVNLFKNPEKVFATGVTVGGVKYLGIKGDDHSIYGKLGAGGVILVKTHTLILIGVYDENMQPGIAANAVERLGDFFIMNDL